MNHNQFESQDLSPTNFELFISQWNAYQAILQHDYLWHSLAEQELHAVLMEKFGQNRSFSFLDLACGDAGPTSRVLASFPKVQYTGVDSSQQALNQARQNTANLGSNPVFQTQDLNEFLANEPKTFDCIYIGMVAHHFGVSGLRKFFELIAQRLSPSGCVLAFETFLLADETRQEHVNRLTAIIRQFWVGMSDQSRQNVIEHVAQSDFPVTFDQWNSEARAGGLGPMMIRAKSPDRLLAFVQHHGNHGTTARVPNSPVKSQADVTQ